MYMSKDTHNGIHNGVHNGIHNGIHNGGEYNVIEERGKLYDEEGLRACDEDGEKKERSRIRDGGGGGGGGEGGGGGGGKENKEPLI